MKALELWSIYLLIGVGAAVALYLRAELGKWDLLLLIPFWPLYGPLLLASAQAPSALQLLPEAELQGRLEARLSSVRGRVRELDQLLDDPVFSPEAALNRQQELEAAGDLRAAASAQARGANIARLVRLQSRYRGELVEVEELMAQLEVQKEVLRRLGATNGDPQDLMLEISARIDGLDEFLDDQELRP